MITTLYKRNQIKKIIIMGCLKIIIVQEQHKNKMESIKIISKNTFLINLRI